MPIHLLLSDILLRPQAYLDPGSGSMLIQGLIALLLAGGLFLKAFWRKIFSKKASNDEIDLPEDNDEVNSDDDSNK